MLKRFELANHPRYPDARAERVRRAFLDAGVGEATSWNLRWVDVIWIESENGPGAALPWEDSLLAILADPVLHERTLHPVLRGPAIERRLLPGMTDNRARSLAEALQLKHPELSPASFRLRIGERVVLESEERFPIEDEAILELLRPAWINPVIHESEILPSRDVENHSSFEADRIAPLFSAVHFAERIDVARVERFDLTQLKGDKLKALNHERMLALSDHEMQAIQEHFSRLGRSCTDVELEIIAQTWSEHCKHKIFAADIDYHSLDAEDPAMEIPRTVSGLFRETIKKTTSELPRPWLLSVFSDNAGIVRFTENEALCLKVETHNSPSALDPFGGAITGIVGVNRDILGSGLGAKPIANMNVFCVAPPETVNPYPEKIIDPDAILEGIRAGVEAGGNQSGIPTINGSVTFHPSYLGKPLVFCGTLGLMPAEVLGRKIEEKSIQPGDRVVMLGGRIGRDGIHGATFSSLALTETVSGSVVQLGDPITQKRMTDFLLEARDRGLYRSITDNGAGGLSSSVGEMATWVGGARIDVALAPTKMPGLFPYERVISESQERMTLAVPSESMAEFMDLASRRGVEATDIGIFETSGQFKVDFNGVEVACLDLDFLHEGAPRLQLAGKWMGRKTESFPGEESPYRKTDALVADWVQVLAHPNVASKEWIIRQYDHEVQGRSVFKPLLTLEKGSSPSDAAVITLSPHSPVAAVLGHGLAPLLSDVDPYLMAQMAVDEALRNVFATGAEYASGDPEKVISLVDNFCWPDPLSSPEKTAALVRTAYGMRKACLEFGIPLISGKDSMKNDFKGDRKGQRIEISVLPTLLMTALGRLPDLSLARSSEFKRPGDFVYCVGPAAVSLAGSIFENLGLNPGKSAAPVLPHYEIARSLYGFLGSSRSSYLASAHDCSEGGLFAAIAEACFARGFGLRFEDGLEWTPTSAFGEGFHRFVLSCSETHAPKFQKEMIENGIPFLHLGRVTLEPIMAVGKMKASISELQEAWSGGGR